jgi:hypothetical protein
MTEAGPSTSSAEEERGWDYAPPASALLVRRACEARFAEFEATFGDEFIPVPGVGDGLDLRLPPTNPQDPGSERLVSIIRRTADTPGAPAGELMIEIYCPRGSTFDVELVVAPDSSAVGRDRGGRSIGTVLHWATEMVTRAEVTDRHTVFGKTARVERMKQRSADV